MEPEAYEELRLLEADHWWYAGMRQITRKLIERHIRRGNPFLILDAGCGAGGNLAALAEFGRTLGLDCSPLALGHAAELHREQLAQASVEALPYPDDAFDLVTSFDVIYCREVGDDQRAISEFARVASKKWRTSF